MTVVKNFRRPFSLDIFYGLWLSCEAGLSLARLRRASESEVSRIFSKIGSDFNQNTPLIKKSGTNPDFLMTEGAGLEPASPEGHWFSGPAE